MRSKRLAGLSLAMLFVSGCASVEYNATNGPKMVVSAERTLFFHNGPLQGNGADLSLAKGDEVEVLRKEIGYSYVRIYDGQNGYVANDDISPATTSEATPEKAASTISLPKTIDYQDPKPVESPSPTNDSAAPRFRF
jgi:uncharacterized protein YgiM (DUF1202 family)